MKLKKSKEEVAYYMRRLYKKGLTTCSGGNISFRWKDDIVLITPSQIDKGTLKAKAIGKVTLSGENLTPEFKLSMETKMHLEVYKARPDISAIVHAHPIFATSYAGTEQEINTNISGESRALLGDLVYADYALMGTETLAQKVSESTKKGNVIIMQNHGVLTVGNSLFEAFDRIEVLEAAAKISYITEMLGKRKELDKNQLKEIDDLFS
jgi:L-fuculose-phosphate aldolase